MPPDRLVWVVAAGPGGGGGGGGNNHAEPPRTVERPGRERTTVPAAAPPGREVPDTLPSTELRVTIPAIAISAGLEEAPGVLTSISIPAAGSRGPGSGPGAGSGRKGGIGPGDGDGLDGGLTAGTGGEIYEPGSGVTMPRVIHDPKPGYTDQAMRAKVQGVVMLEAVVAPDGTVGSVQVTRSLDAAFGLDQEAVRTIERWRFLPGMRGNKPVPVRVAIEMTFSLR